MKKVVFISILILLLLAGTVACAAPETVYQGAVAPEPEPAPAPTSAVDESVSTFKLSSGSAPAPEIIVETPPVPAPVEEPIDINDGETIERMIIRTGSMVLVVEDVPAAIQSITDLATAYDGFVVSSNSWEDRDRKMGNIAIRVAVEYFEDTLADLRNMAEEVKSESTSGTDVTEEYVDLEAQLRNLEASEAQLLKLLEEETDNVSDILEVQRELVNTRDQIERIEGRMKYLEQSAALSYIQVELEQSKLTVEFVAYSRNVKEGEDVIFEPVVAGGFEPYSYEWDFGDGTTSTEDYPRHAYNDEGKYTVSLTVTDDRGNTAPYQREDYVNVIAGWKASNTVSSAWNGLSAFGRFLLDLVIWLGILCPIWIVVGVILYFAWWRKRKKKE